MHIINRFLAVGFLAFALPVSLTIAQVPIPDSDAELQIKRLEKQADSLKKEARHLKDSLHGKIRHKDFGNLFLNADSLLNKFRVFPFDSDGEFHFDGDSAHWSGNWPDSLSFKGWAEIPKHKLENLPHWKLDPFSIPNWKFDPFDTPKKEKKKSPLEGFEGWYMQELARL